MLLPQTLPARAQPFHTNTTPAQRGGHHTIGRVLDGDDDAGSEHELLPSFGQVDHVQTISAALPDVGDLPTRETPQDQLADSTPDTLVAAFA